MKEKLIVIIGPTAVGKTKTSIELAKVLNGEIISGDSMQIYRRMDIGTAKVTEEEMQGIPHHLIDIKDPNESFSVAEFQSIVREKISEITARGKLPILVGGTGLYVQSVIYEYQFSDIGKDDEYRERLEKRVKDEGIEPLFEELKKVDSISADKIHPNNTRRVIRALEVFHSTNIPMSQQQQSLTNESPYDFALIGLTMDREKLYERINSRVEQMVEQGLLEEVKRLYDSGLRNCQSVQAIGYKELYDYFDGVCSYEDSIELLKRNSRRYAKRQMTWFRNKMDVTWFDMTEMTRFDEIFEEIFQDVAGKLSYNAN
jgi:tRNA dimethylallyltransferase